MSTAAPVVTRQPVTVTPIFTTYNLLLANAPEVTTFRGDTFTPEHLVLDVHPDGRCHVFIDGGRVGVRSWGRDETLPTWLSDLIAPYLVQS